MTKQLDLILIWDLSVAWKTDLPPAAALSGPTPASSAACIIDALLGGGRVSLDGVAARGLVEATEKGPHNLRI